MSYESIIELSSDHKKLIITNRVPIAQIDYTNEPDPEKFAIMKE